MEKLPPPQQPLRHHPVFDEFTVEARVALAFAKVLIEVRQKVA